MEVIQLLIKTGSKLESEIYSLLFSCGIEKHPCYLDVAKMLIEAGADINWSSYDGEIGLFKCITEISSKLDLLKLLMDHGAEIDVVDSTGWSLLDEAIRF